jgi:nickel transport protein
VFTESYFSGGVKVRNGLIQVFDASGKKLLEGHTNSKGEYSFQIPEKRDLKIVVNASMGHRGEFVLKREDLGETAASEGKKEPAVSVQKTASKAPEKVDMAQLKRMVEQALDSRLRPIAHSIARLQEKKGPGLTEVVGGIGYIFGIMGLLLYFRSRKK